MCFFGYVPDLMETSMYLFLLVIPVRMRDILFSGRKANRDLVRKLFKVGFRNLSLLKTGYFGVDRHILVAVYSVSCA